MQPWPVKLLVDYVLGDAPRGGLFAQVIDRLPGAESRRGLLVWVVAAGVGVFAINSAAEVLLTRAWIRVGQQLVSDLAADLFARVQRRSVVFHTRNSVGDLM